MHPVRVLALIALAVPLAACSWLPAAVIQGGPVIHSYHGHAAGVSVSGCTEALGSSSGAPTVAQPVPGPVLTPRRVERTFARLGIRPHPTPLKLFRQGGGRRLSAFFTYFDSGPSVRRITNGTVAVYRTDADAFAVERSYGPHKRGDCFTNLRVGNVVIQRTGPMSGRLREAISRLRSGG